MTAIDDKWHQIPWVGNPKDEGAGSEEVPTSDGRGRQRDFDNATIVWTPQTGAHEVHGDIRVKWAMNGWLGYPLTDETGTPDGVGRYNHFENGRSIGPRIAARSSCTARFVTSGRPGLGARCGRLPEE